MTTGERALELLKQLEGKKTHILVALAIFVYLMGAISNPNGLTPSQIDSRDVVTVLLIACISTFKMGLERTIRES